MAITEQTGIKETVLKTIENSPGHAVFFLNDFAESGYTESTKKAFQEAPQWIRSIVTRLSSYINNMAH